MARRQIQGRSHDEQLFLTGVTDALWIPAWASAEEERGRTYSGRLEDVAPPPPPSARRAAEEFLRAFERVNRLPLGLILSVVREVEHGADASEFGYGVAMPALGHGVSWTDNHDAPVDLKIPQIEAYADKYRGRWTLNVSGLEDPERLAEPLRDRQRAARPRGRRARGARGTRR